MTNILNELWDGEIHPQDSLMTETNTTKICNICCHATKRILPKHCRMNKKSCLKNIATLWAR